MAASGLVLDTSAYAAYRRGLAVAVEEIQLAEMILVPTIVLGELLSGFALGARHEQNRLELAGFLAQPRVRLLSIGHLTAERYAVLLVYLRKIGKPIPTNDLWIAASTWENGGLLLTADSHFENIPQIILHKIS